MNKTIPARAARRLAAIALAPVLLAWAACVSAQAATPDAAPKPDAGRQCVSARSINGFQSVSRDSVNLRVGVSDVYHVELFLPCNDLPFAQGIALRTHAGSDFICNAVDADLIVPGPSGPQRCPLREIRKLTPAEVAALPPKQRP